MIFEVFERIERFELRIKEGETWRAIARGTDIGPSRTLRFDPVTARFVRLSILKARHGATIREIHLYMTD
jgi:hypothetical protein